MKKSFFLVGLSLLLSVFIYGQTKPDYSGMWTFNKNQSKTAKSLPIATMTMKVNQTKDKITIDTAVTYESPTVKGGNGVADYSLDGEEVTYETQGFNGKVMAKKKGEILADGKLNLTISRPTIVEGVQSSSTTNNVWSLSEDGKTLKILRTIKVQTLDDQVSELIFTKN